MGIAAQEKWDHECRDNVGRVPSCPWGSCRLFLVLEVFVDTLEQVKEWLCLVKRQPQPVPRASWLQLDTLGSIRISKSNVISPPHRSPCPGTRLSPG